MQDLIKTLPTVDLQGFGTKVFEMTLADKKHRPDPADRCMYKIRSSLRGHWIQREC